MPGVAVSGGGGRARRARAAALLALAFSLPGTAAFADDEPSCAAAVDEATADYDLGLLEDVLAELAPCDERGVARTDLAAAHALRAKALLGLDRVDEARAEVAALLRADPAFQPGPPPAFARLVEEVRGVERTPKVASVSKTPESLREAPATVVVVTAEEIERRGYLDLEELLYDLPGFDVSRGNGEVYSNYYQRGFRSDLNDRNLLLLDGVEQHEPSTNVVLLSRQYALSSIDRVEVVYGPSSTIYGANAYTGVMSITTKAPEALAGSKKFGLSAQAASGSFGTRYADLTLAGQTPSGAVAWTASGRVHHSDEYDLSGFPDWDYDYANVDYGRSLRLEGVRAAQFCGFQSQPFVCAQVPSPYYRPVFDAQGRLLAVEATAEGAQVARELDRQFLARNHFHFSDPTDDLFFYGKLRLSNVTLGLQFHRLKEGNLGITTERLRPGAEDGALFTSHQIFFYVNFSRSVGTNLTLSSLTRYATAEVERGNSAAIFFTTYAGTLLGLGDLIRPCAGGDPGSPPASCPAQPAIFNLPLSAVSSQVTTELSLAYDPSERFNAIGGIYLNRSFVQSDLLDVPEKTTRVHDNLAGYLQTSYRPRKTLKLVAGGRFDYNRLEGQQGEEGFGTVFSPRLAVIFTPGSGRSVYKAIYAEAFKDPSDAEKFTAQIFARDLPAGGLRPEKVRNFELGGDWRPMPGLSLGLAAYQADYSDVVGLRVVTQCLGGPSTPPCFAGTQLHNGGEATIRGAQLQFQYHQQRGELFGNYTYADPRQTEPLDLRIGDIASHRLNLGVDVFWRPDLTSDLRVNYVGERKTGAGTTVSTNPLSQVDAYTVTSTTLTYRLPLRWSFSNSKLQLVVDNLFDETVYHPGVRGAGLGFAAQIRQPGRRIYLRFLTVAPGRGA